MHKWYVVQCFSSEEKKTKKAIEDNLDLKGMRDIIAEVLLPTENVSEVKRGKQTIVEKRLWPGYLLIKMTLTDESWHYIKDTPGIIEFLGGETPTALTEIEVTNILADLENKKQTVTQKHKFEIGSRVKITDGVFVNFVGVVTEVFLEKGRMSVMVSIFGRDTRVDDLEFSQVEEMAEGAEGS